MPVELKVAALLVTAAGLITALELASLASKQANITPKIVPHNFSNMLGYFPTLVHRHSPKAALLLGQTVANQMIDQTWIEQVTPKAISSAASTYSSKISDMQRGSIKGFLTIFTLTLATATLITLWLASI